MFSADLLEQAEDLLEACRRNGLTLATAESCTGGLLSGLLTEIAGSSDVFDRGFVTYSNLAKMEQLGVSPDTLAEHGAVSEPVARAMAQGAIAVSVADLAVSITGIAGPGGGSDDKPVGLVHMATALRSGETLHVAKKFGDIGRHEVRIATVVEAVALLATRVELLEASGT